MKKWIDVLMNFLLVISVSLFMWILGNGLFNYLNNDPNVDKLIKWFESKDKLSGWAQFIGASIAILLAVVIPAWQRYAQQLDRRRDRADFEASLSETCYFLLIEINEYLKNHIKRKEKSRNEIRNDVLRDDLLNRIHSVEMKEISPKRVGWLIKARRALHTVNSLGCSIADQNLKLSDIENAEVEISILAVEECIKNSRTEHLKTFNEMLLIHYPLYIRIGLSIYYFIKP